MLMPYSVITQLLRQKEKAEGKTHQLERSASPPEKGNS